MTGVLVGSRFVCKRYDTRTLASDVSSERNPVVRRGAFVLENTLNKIDIIITGKNSEVMESKHTLNLHNSDLMKF